eukprot:scaffold1488_cov141-Amphora_coffeaeformis.AAC.7
MPIVYKYKKAIDVRSHSSAHARKIIAAWLVLAPRCRRSSKHWEQAVQNFRTPTDGQRLCRLKETRVVFLVMDRHSNITNLRHVPGLILTYT